MTQIRPLYTLAVSPYIRVAKQNKQKIKNKKTTFNDNILYAQPHKGAVQFLHLEVCRVYCVEYSVTFKCIAYMCSLCLSFLEM